MPQAFHLLMCPSRWEFIIGIRNVTPYGIGKWARGFKTSCLEIMAKLGIKRKHIWVIDQVWGQDGWILAKFFFCVFMDRDGVKVHKLAKKERKKEAWSMKDILYGLRGNFSCGRRRVGLSGQDSAILSARVANHSTGFYLSCPLTELAI